MLGDVWLGLEVGKISHSISKACGCNKPIRGTQLVTSFAPVHEWENENRSDGCSNTHVHACIQYYTLMFMGELVIHTPLIWSRLLQKREIFLEHRHLREDITILKLPLVKPQDSSSWNGKTRLRRDEWMLENAKRFKWNPDIYNICFKDFLGSSCLMASYYCTPYNLKLLYLSFEKSHLTWFLNHTVAYTYTACCWKDKERPIIVNQS